jgi:hypothetical protein
MNKKPAYSLIFAFIMMTVIMVIATTTIQDTRNKLHLFSNLESSSQARLAAESAAELGIVALKDPSTYGYDSGTEEPEVFCLQYGSRTDCQGEGDYTIHADATEHKDTSSGLYYLPIPGTGNAAPSEDCSILDEQKDVHHSCNWNKLISGETITIPMHYDDGYGNITYPTSSDLTEWSLLLRTPCEDSGVYSEDCDGNNRYDFNGDASQGTTSDPLIAYWQLDYELSDGTISSLFPDDYYYISTYNYRILTNNEISEYSINSAAADTADTYKVLTANSTATNSDPYDYAVQATLVDLYFTFKVIGSLVDDSSLPIPYLEWQIQWESSSPIIAPTSTIVGKGYYESGGDTYYHPYSISYSSIGNVTSVYTLSN